MIADVSDLCKSETFGERIVDIAGSGITLITADQLKEQFCCKRALVNRAVPYCRQGLCKTEIAFYSVKTDHRYVLGNLHSPFPQSLDHTHGDSRVWSN